MLSAQKAHIAASQTRLKRRLSGNVTLIMTITTLAMTVAMLTKTKNNAPASVWNIALSPLCKHEPFNQYRNNPEAIDARESAALKKVGAPKKDRGERKRRNRYK